MKEIIDALALNYCPLSILIIAVGVSVSIVIASIKGTQFISIDSSPKEPHEKV